MSPASSADDPAAGAARTSATTTAAEGEARGRAHFQQELRALEMHALGGLDLVVERRQVRMRERMSLEAK